MIIRKLFKVENSHIVRNCSTQRCSHSIHGHSAVIELFFTASGLDNGQMIVDFGLLKGPIKEFIDSFDHCHIIWNKESAEYKEFFYKNNERWIELPVSPSAEQLSLMMFYIIDIIISRTLFNNGERCPQLVSVRYHETETGYAESFREDLCMWKHKLKDIVFSPGIRSDWKFFNLDSFQPFINPTITQQIC